MTFSVPTEKGKTMTKKFRNGMVYLFKFLYELGVIAAIYFVAKCLAESAR